mmetsp:Transcript_23682/g.54698  ORF Transcript_23682/g.54698 Transcript_23682/m.54698 type:complete len:290 (-) Transcript_23682:130-999(-)
MNKESRCIVVHPPQVKLLNVEGLDLLLGKSMAQLSVKLTGRLCFSLSIVIVDCLVYSAIFAPALLAVGRLPIMMGFYSAWLAVCWALWFLLTVDPSDYSGREGQEVAFCQQCRKDVPCNSKHCRVCKKCVPEFDHHCVWLNTCIGVRNYHAFAVLISSLSCMFFIFLWSEHALMAIEGFTLMGLSRSSTVVITGACGVPNAMLLVLALGLTLLHLYLRFWMQTTMYGFLKEGRQARKERLSTGSPRSCTCSYFRRSMEARMADALPMTSQLSLLSADGTPSSCQGIQNV